MIVPLHDELNQLITLLHKHCQLNTADISLASEGKEYAAASLTIQHKHVQFRVTKSTPKKIGFFVTLWQRGNDGIIAPYHTAGTVDAAVIVTRTASHAGIFVFPRAALEHHRIFSTPLRTGKLGFRVYAPWDQPTSPQAQASQRWQTRYFAYLTDIDRIQKLFDLN